LKITLFNDMPEEGFLSMDRYGRSLGAALRASGLPDLEVTDFTTTFPGGPVPGFLRRFTGRYLKYPWQMQRSKAAVNHVTDHSYGFLTYFLPRRNCVVTCHDLAPLLAETPTLKSRIKKQVWKIALRGALRAPFIITVSESTRRDILKYTGCPADRLHVVYNGLSERFGVLKDSTEYKAWEKAFREKHGITEEKIVLHVGRYSPRKNFEGVLNAFAALTELAARESAAGPGPVRLLQVGGEFTPEHQALIARAGIGGRVTRIAFMPDEELPHVYNLASVFLFPSFYEGFGWPPLEAMACGIPVITSNTSSLPEVAGEAARLVGPEDTAGMARALFEVLTDKQVSADLRKKGLERVKLFSWQRCAEQTAEVYRKAALQQGRSKTKN
jgi:glycosyltransferase involved in cell wall biosynthesis